jgi:hypothetical protein
MPWLRPTGSRAFRLQRPCVNKVRVGAPRLLVPATGREGTFVSLSGHTDDDWEAGWFTTIAVQIGEPAGTHSGSLTRLGEAAMSSHWPLLAAKMVSFQTAIDIRSSSRLEYDTGSARSEVLPRLYWVRPFSFSDKHDDKASLALFGSGNLTRHRQ